MTIDIDNNNNAKVQLFLASDSPRRVQLLKSFHENTVVVGHSYDEDNYVDGVIDARNGEAMDCDSAAKMIQIVALNKGLSAVGKVTDYMKDSEGYQLGQHQEENTDRVGMIIVAADTLILHQGEIIGKPNSKRKARDILRLLSGNEHQVVTGLAIITLNLEGQILQSSTLYDLSLVRIRNMKHGDIKMYINKHKPLDKAGSYGIQDKFVAQNDDDRRESNGYSVVESFEGDYFNILGLPMKELCPLLLPYKHNLL